MYRINYYDNDLYFVCFMIETLARSTKNSNKEIVNTIGKKGLSHLYKSADVMHCENPLAIIDEFIEDFNITSGNTDNIINCRFSIPSCSAMGKIYMRLILNSLPIECHWKAYITNPHPNLVIDHLIKIYNSWISEIIDNYNTTMFTESAEYIYDCYVAKTILG